MNWTTIIWSACGGLCLALAAVHLLVWVKSRNAWANLFFAISAVSAAATAMVELNLMYAQTPEAYGELLHWKYLSIGILTISLVWFIHFYLRGGSVWLVWLFCAWRGLTQILDFLVDQGIYFREITGLRQIHFLDEIVVLPIGVVSSWAHFANAANLVLIMIALDGGIAAWRQGNRRRAAVVPSTIVGAVVLGMVQLWIMERGVLSMPHTVSMVFLIIVLGMAYELSADLISARQLAQDLNLSQERMRLSAHAADIGLWEWDVVRDEFWVNEVGRARVGAGESELIDFNRVVESAHPDDRVLLRQAVRRMREGEEGLRIEYRIIAPDGGVRWLEVSGLVERGLNNQLLRVRGVSVDITERKSAELALRKSETLFRATFEQAAVGIAHVSSQGRFLRTNRKFCDLLGYSQQEMLERTFQAITNPDDLAASVELVTRLLNGEISTYTMEKRYLHKNGAAIWVSLTGSLVRKKTGEPDWFVAVVKDISERKQVENALKKSEDRLREAQRLAHIGHWELDLLTDELFWSDEVFRIFEIDRDRFGASYEYFLSSIHPEDRDAVNMAYTQSLKTHQPYSISHRLLMPDGRIKHVHEQCETVYDAGGKPLRSTGTIQDITERKQMENEKIRLRDELAHLNNVMTIGELSHSLAHEINQPLGAIINNAAAALSIASKHEKGNDDLREILEDIIKDTNRAGQIIRKIRGVVKKEETQPELLNMDAIIKEVIDLFKSAFSLDHISLQLDLHTDLPPIRGDRVRLQQVLTNLIANALEAMSAAASKVLTIRCALAAPDMVTVSISDTGTGIDEKISDKIFQPFFTTKKGGLGIGLRLCRSIIEEHGGRIWMENNPREGATFLFSLKANQGESP